MIASLLLLLQGVAASGGQASPPPGGPPASCQAFERAPEGPGGGQPEGAVLYVGCGRSAVRVGKVESYRSSYNPGLATLAVAVQENGRARVLVARSAADGTIEIQDVSRDLAKLAGEPLNVGLRGLDADLRRFAADGSLAAASAGRAAGARLTPDRYAPPAAERRDASPDKPAEGAGQ